MELGECVSNQSSMSHLKAENCSWSGSAARTKQQRPGITKDDKSNVAQRKQQRPGMAKNDKNNDKNTTTNKPSKLQPNSQRTTNPPCNSHGYAVLYGSCSMWSSKVEQHVDIAPEILDSFAQVTPTASSSH